MKRDRNKIEKEWYFNKSQRSIRKMASDLKISEKNIQFCVLPVADANDKYVFIIARCCCSGASSRAELKLGQNIHKNNVPIIANKSDAYTEPSSFPLAAPLSSFWLVFGRIIKLTAKPK